MTHRAIFREMSIRQVRRSNEVVNTGTRLACRSSRKARTLRASTALKSKAPV